MITKKEITEILSNHAGYIDRSRTEQAVHEDNFNDVADVILSKFSQHDVSGSASDFERELYKLINAYVSAGLKKPDLVHKMEYIAQSCMIS